MDNQDAQRVVFTGRRHSRVSRTGFAQAMASRQGQGAAPAQSTSSDQRNTQAARSPSSYELPQLERKPIPVSRSPAKKQPPLQTGRSTQKFAQYLHKADNITALIQSVLREVVLYKPADPLMYVTHFFKNEVDKRFLQETGDDASGPVDASLRPSSRAKLRNEADRLRNENLRYQLHLQNKGPSIAQYEEMVAQRDTELNRLREQAAPLRTQNRKMRDHCSLLESKLRKKTAEAERLQQQLDELLANQRQEQLAQSEARAEKQAVWGAVAEAERKEQEFDVEEAADVVDVRTEWEKMEDEGVVIGKEGRRLLELENAARIQAWVRGVLVRRTMRSRGFSPAEQQAGGLFAESMHKARLGVLPAHMYSADHHRAATKLQALHRGRAQRHRARRHAAATKIQAAHRGRVQRVHNRRQRELAEKKNTPHVSRHRVSHAKPSSAQAGHGVPEIVEDIGGGGSSVRLNLIEDSQSPRPTDEETSGAVATAECALYEKPDAGLPSPPWKYRGPAAEATAKEGYTPDNDSSAAGASPTAEESLSSAGESAGAPPSEVSDTSTSGSSSGVGLFEKPEVGVASPNWRYRGPVAEKAAVAAYAE